MKRIVITPGEPAGIGPDITLRIAAERWPAELIVIADPDVLMERAKKLSIPLTLIEYDLNSESLLHQPHTLKIIPIKIEAPVQPGKLNIKNAHYVIATLKKAAELCLSKKINAVVTGPVQKSILNQANISFTGHTEFFAEYCGIPQTVMLFVVDELKAALVTTHIPLAEVASAITKERLRSTLSILNTALKQHFHLHSPKILICGLNPHAGENGYLGKEEINIITPVLEELRHQQYELEGPLSADTIFTPQYMKRADAVLGMYHDQVLPLIKYLGFGHAVNVTLGLPFIRTSVDHGTALDIAGTAYADAGSLKAALKLAIELS